MLHNLTYFTYSAALLQEFMSSIALQTCCFSYKMSLRRMGKTLKEKKKIRVNRILWEGHDELS